MVPGRSRACLFFLALCVLVSFASSSASPQAVRPHLTADGTALILLEEIREPVEKQQPLIALELSRDTKTRQIRVAGRGICGSRHGGSPLWHQDVEDRTLRGEAGRGVHPSLLFGRSSRGGGGAHVAQVPARPGGRSDPDASRFAVGRLGLAEATSGEAARFGTD